MIFSGMILCCYLPDGVALLRASQLLIMTITVTFPVIANAGKQSSVRTWIASYLATPYHDDSSKTIRHPNGVKQSMRVHWIASLRSQ
jgi:hypothetical protein